MDVLTENNGVSIGTGNLVKREKPASLVTMAHYFYSSEKVQERWRILLESLSLVKQEGYSIGVSHSLKALSILILLT